MKVEMKIFSAKYFVFFKPTCIRRPRMHGHAHGKSQASHQQTLRQSSQRNVQESTDEEHCGVIPPYPPDPQAGTGRTANRGCHLQLALAARTRRGNRAPPRSATLPRPRTGGRTEEPHSPTSLSRVLHTDAQSPHKPAIHKAGQERERAPPTPRLPNE